MNTPAVFYGCEINIGREARVAESIKANYKNEILDVSYENSSVSLVPENDGTFANECNFDFAMPIVLSTYQLNN